MTKFGMSQRNLTPAIIDDKSMSAISVITLIVCLVLGYSRLLSSAPSEWSIYGDYSIEIAT